MSLEMQIAFAVNLLWAGLLGLVIGLDRERKHFDAGVRTHMLVCAGSCLFTLLSVHAFESGDRARVAAQIVSGIGFLGAGAILKQGANVQGLTTAASIWATAAVGMSVGTGAWFLALLATLFIWFVLAVIDRVKKADKRRKRAQRTEQQAVD